MLAATIDGVRKRELVQMPVPGANNNVPPEGRGEPGRATGRAAAAPPPKTGPSTTCATEGRGSRAVS